MIAQKRWGPARENARGLAFNFGLGSIFSLIVVYFIFLYSRDKGWDLLALISKWYLIVAGGLIALSFGIILLVLLLTLLIFLISMLKLHGIKKTYKKQSKNYVDVEYNVKE